MKMKRIFLLACVVGSLAAAESLRAAEPEKTAPPAVSGSTHVSMDVARATSSPMRSSIRRSTPAMGEATHGSRAAWTATRREKSALISMRAWHLPPRGS